MARKTTKKASKAKKSTHHMPTGAKVAIGVGVTTAAAAALGGYFLYGSKNAKQNRKKVKSWALKAKAEVLEGIENVKNITEEEYNELVDTAVKVYAKTAKVSKAEAAQFSREMKQHWKHIQQAGAKKKTATKRKKASSKKKTTTRKKSAKKTTKKAKRKR